MQRPYCINNTKYYSKRGEKFNTENPIWVEYLPRDNDGMINLTHPLAIDLALLHSRDYQSQFESVYLTALELSGNRFEFDTQWFGGVGAAFAADGEDLGNGRILDVTASRLGFTRSLAGGGQFATSVLNSLTWDFGSSTISTGSASLVTTFTQPLLRGAFRHVRLEGLTQAERNLLYAVRDFARFRRGFHVDVSTSYLSLLTQVQGLRNLETNLENLRQNLVEYEVYLGMEMAAQIQRDQVFQQYQSGRLALLRAEQNLAESLDQFKFELGLPPWVPLEIDESLLEPFALVDSELVELQNEAQVLYQSLVQFVPPEKAPQTFMLEAYQRYVTLRDEVAERTPGIQLELQRWSTRLEETNLEELPDSDRLDLQQQSVLANAIRESLTSLEGTLNDRDEFDSELLRLLQSYNQIPEGYYVDKARADTPPEVIAWEELTDAIGSRLREEISELYVAQTQIRLFQIEVEPQLDIDQEQAISFALQSRLDLMNSKARVVDAYRRVEVAADALQSDLSLTGTVALGSDPAEQNAYRFDANNNRYTAGVEFDGPLNRLNERNNYRATQLAYQRATRGYMSDKDRVANEVRSVLRQLELARLSFQIARQQLVAATRQVEQAQFDLRTRSQSDSNLTLFLLEALEGSLDARNNLIVNWTSYRIQKMRLFAALELLYLDEGAQWINEELGLERVAEFDFVDTEYFPPEWVADLDLSGGVRDSSREELPQPPQEEPPLSPEVAQ